MNMHGVQERKVGIGRYNRSIMPSGLERRRAIGAFSKDLFRDTHISMADISFDSCTVITLIGGFYC